MKRIFTIFTFVCLVLLMTACTSNKSKPFIFIDRNKDKIEESSITFKIQQIKLAKGFQNLDPKVEVLKKDNGSRLLVSLGLLETSGVNVTNINKIGDEINIYLKNVNDPSTDQLAIPQIIVELKGIKLKTLENTKFNIINENYTPLKVKLSANDIVNKVNSDFQIVTSTSPEIDITKDGDKLLWKLNYKNILDKYNLDTPVVNLSVVVDANSGELFESSKNFISTFLDEGTILDYIPNEYILYKKEDNNLSNGSKWISLYLYDIVSNTREVIYSTGSEVISGLYNKHLDSISVLESNNGVNQIYIVHRKDSKAYKVMLDSTINPAIIKWKDKENLVILSKTNLTSTIYNYNVMDTNITSLHFMYLDIIGMQIQDEDIIITVKDEDTGKYSIQINTDQKAFKLERDGYLPKFLSEDYFGFLQFNEKTDVNELIIVNKNTNKIYSVIDLNISNYYRIDNDTIGIISTNSKNNDFTFHKYHINDKQLESITNINTDKAYYDSINNLLYMDLKVPFESPKPQIIYSLNLNNLNNTEPMVTK